MSLQRLPSAGAESTSVTPLTAVTTFDADCVGRAFVLYQSNKLFGPQQQERVSKIAKVVEEETQDEGSSEDDTEKTQRDRTRAKGNRGKWGLYQNHYRVLGLAQLAHQATDDDVAKAYRKAVMTHHPDKPGGSETMFKKVQLAFDTLTNKQSRRAFDSHHHTDDGVPAGIKNGDFYGTFGPVFARNARFSNTQPVPELLGDDATDAQVDEFYDFWLEFDSWRDFSGYGENSPADIKQCADRVDKRRLERENEADAQRRKKADNQRLINLVEQARKLDPRLQRRKDREAKAKADEVQRKAEAKAKAEADLKAAAEKAAAEEAAKKAEADAAKQQGKKAHEARKKAEKEARKRARKLAEEKSIDAAKMDELLAALSPEHQLNLVEEMSAPGADATTVFNARFAATFSA